VENCALPDLNQKRKPNRKPKRAAIDPDVLPVHLSPQLQRALADAARESGQSEADFLKEAITEAISKRRRIDDQAARDSNLAK